MINMQISMSRWMSYIIGYVFITSGVMKLLVADFKNSFINLGLPFPTMTLFLVAITEIACGSLIVANMYVKQAIIPLTLIMIGALYLTKFPLLVKQDLLSFLFESRLDVVMFILLLVLWKRVPN